MVVVHYLATQIPGMCIGLFVGAFMPGIGRVIKDFFVKETKKIV